MPAAEATGERRSPGRRGEAEAGSQETPLRPKATNPSRKGRLSNMNARLGALAALITLSAAPAAFAESATVDVRAEGTRTWVELPLVDDGGTVRSADGTSHACDGTNGGANPRPGPTAMHALTRAL